MQKALKSGEESTNPTDQTLDGRPSMASHHPNRDGKVVLKVWEHAV